MVREAGKRIAERLEAEMIEAQKQRERDFEEATKHVKVTPEELNWFVPHMLPPLTEDHCDEECNRGVEFVRTDPTHIARREKWVSEHFPPPAVGAHRDQKGLRSAEYREKVEEEAEYLDGYLTDDDKIRGFMNLRDWPAFVDTLVAADQDRLDAYLARIEADVMTETTPAKKRSPTTRKEKGKEGESARDPDGPAEVVPNSPPMKKSPPVPPKKLRAKTLTSSATAIAASSPAQLVALPAIAASSPAPTVASLAMVAPSPAHLVAPAAPAAPTPLRVPPRPAPQLPPRGPVPPRVNRAHAPVPSRQAVARAAGISAITPARLAVAKSKLAAPVVAPPVFAASPDAPAPPVSAARAPPKERLGPDENLQGASIDEELIYEWKTPRAAFETCRGLFNKQALKEEARITPYCLITGSERYFYHRLVILAGEADVRNGPREINSDKIACRRFGLVRNFIYTRYLDSARTLVDMPKTDRDSLWHYLFCDTALPTRGLVSISMLVELPHTVQPGDDYSVAEELLHRKACNVRPLINVAAMNILDDTIVANTVFCANALLAHHYQRHSGLYVADFRCGLGGQGMGVHTYTDTEAKKLSSKRSRNQKIVLLSVSAGALSLVMLTGALVLSPWARTCVKTAILWPCRALTLPTLRQRLMAPLSGRELRPRL